MSNSFLTQGQKKPLKKFMTMPAKQQRSEKPLWMNINLYK